jgi:hypothetical protein
MAGNARGTLGSLLIDSAETVAAAASQPPLPTTSSQPSQTMQEEIMPAPATELAMDREIGKPFRIIELDDE